MKLIGSICLGALCLITACKGDARKEAAPQPSAGSAPAPAGSGSAAPTTDANALRIRKDGVGPVKVGMPIDKATLAKLLPGTSIEEVEEGAEEETYTTFVVSRGKDVLFQLVPVDGKVVSIMVLGRAVESELGFKVGSKYEEVTGQGALACEKPDPNAADGAGSGHIVCSSGALPDAWLFFAKDEQTKAQAPMRGVGIEIPAADTAKQLAGFDLEAIELAYNAYDDPAVPKGVQLETGEKFASPPEGTSRVEAGWEAGGETFFLAAIERGDKLVIRAFGNKSAAFDVDVIEPIGSLGATLTRTKDGIVFTSKDLAGRAAEVGALLAYEARLITFDGGKPKVAKKWSCDETTAKKGICNLPAWAEAK